MRALIEQPREIWGNRSSLTQSPRLAASLDLSSYLPVPCGTKEPGPDDARSRLHSPREEARPMGGASMPQSRFCRDQISW